MRVRAGACALFLALASALAPWLAWGGDVDSDKQALEALYDATGGDSWTDGAHWKSATEPLGSWHGVTTDGDGRVTGLALGDNGLDGALPAALGSLDKLETLDLSDNALTGALPSQLANLAVLKELILRRSRALAGALPSGLMQLADLATVAIDETELCAPGGDAFQAWVATISFAGLRCPPAADSVIDVAVFYTPAARDAEGGATAMRNKIDHLVAWTNDAYSRSGVKQRVNLVAVAETDYVQENSDVDLARLWWMYDGHMDEVHEVRNNYAADLVMLIRSRDATLRYGAVVKVMNTVSTDFESKAFAWSIADGAVFAHELGHLMGLNHERRAVCPSPYACSRVSFPYAFAHVHCGTSLWKTVMGSGGARCGEQYAPAHQNFSNPEKAIGAVPMGVAGLAPTDSADGPADAVRALNRTRAYVSEFRRAPDITASFDAASYTAAEGGSDATVTVSLSAAPTRPIRVPVIATPSAGAAENDYSVPSSVLFGAEETVRTFRVAAVDDQVDDDGEALLLTLGLPRGVTLGSPRQAAVSLVDDDVVPGAPGVLSVALTSQAPVEFDDGGHYGVGDAIEASVRFNKTVTVTGAPQLTLTLGSGTREAAYRSAAREFVRFAYAVAAGDLDTDGVGVDANGLTLNGGTIRDAGARDALLAHPAAAEDRAHQADGVKPALERAHTVGPTELSLDFDEPLDRNSVPAASAFRVAVDGAAIGVAQVAVSDSTASLTLSGSIADGEDCAKVGYTPGAAPIRDRAGNAAAAFRDVAVDAGSPAEVSLSASPNPVAEGSAVTVTAQLSRALNCDVTVPTALAAGSAEAGDHGALSGIAVTGGSTSGAGTVATAQDADTADETFTVSLGDLPPSLASGSPSSVQVAITDDDPPPPSIAIAPKAANTPVAEGTDAAFTVTASGAPAAALTVSLAVADASGPSDFVTSGNEGSKSVTIAAGSATAAFTVPTQGDRADEPDGDVTVTVTASQRKPADYAVGSPSSASVRVTDDDATTGALTGSAAALPEGTGRDFTLSIGRALQAGESLAVPLAFAGTATRGTDYTTACPGQPPAGVSCADLDDTGQGSNPRVTFTGRVGGSATSVTLTLTAAADAATEADGETVNVNPGAGAGPITDGFGQFTITDPPKTPTASFSASGYSADEGDAVSVTLNISPTRNAGTAVAIAYTDGTAGSADYSQAPASVTIPANQPAATFTVATAEDATVEEDETFTIAIGTLPDGVDAGSPSSATLTIGNDDQLPTVSIAPGSAAAAGADATFTVT
ncbi:MAG: SwmB domain-containing protein, partial [Gammaproteobacteria bacterium]|nr:SwmB domain-containing protein [Gammaproteobacteria bacterium]